MEPLIELTKALAKAQGDFKPIRKTATNPHFRSKYATLDGVIEATQPSLQKHGLAIAQLPEAEELITILLHESGEQLQTRTPIINERGGSQGYGAALTYARRYAYSAILSVASEEDTDGNVPQKATNRAAPTPPPPPEKKTLTVAQYRKLRDKADDQEKWGKLGKWLKLNGANKRIMTEYEEDMAAWTANHVPPESEEAAGFMSGLDQQPPEGGNQ